MTFPENSGGNIGEFLRFAEKRLKNAGIENPRFDAEIMLGKILGLSRMGLFLQRTEELLNPAKESLEEFILRRISGEPLQYIIGETEFFSLPFKTDTRALIPRPETEILVEWALEIIGASENWRILDIGTGSGAIAIAIAANSSAVVTAVDISEKALELAKENSELNGIGDRIIFLQADALEDNFAEITGGEYDLALSNPPYISQDEISGLQREIREHEPLTALTDGGDGLVFFRRLADALPRLCKNEGWLLMETADNRSQAVKSIFEKKYHQITIRNDLAGKPRVLGVKNVL